MKGIILAGGKATRLYPITKGVCKQLLPVYDKPMIYYPLSVVMLAGIRDILIISTAKDTPRIKDLLGDGSDIGVRLQYAVQDAPRGIAESLIIGAGFLEGKPCCLVLGDNIFYGHNMTELLQEARESAACGATVFGYYVRDPERYGVLEFDGNCRVTALEEKPLAPKSNWVVTGLYFYDATAPERAALLKPSGRGELEITDLNKTYLREGTLKVKLLDRGYAWLDTGTYNSLIDASIFIKTIEDRQGLKIGCIEEVAFRKGFIDRAQLARLGASFQTSYGEYLTQLSNE